MLPELRKLNLNIEELLAPLRLTFQNLSFYNFYHIKYLKVSMNKYAPSETQIYGYIFRDDIMNDGCISATKTTNKILINLKL